MTKSMVRRKSSPPADCHQVRMPQPPMLPQGSEGGNYCTPKHPSSAALYDMIYHDTYIMVYV